MSSSKTVGKIIRVEIDEEDNDVRIVMRITDEMFKYRVIHSRDFEDILRINGRDIIIDE